VNWEAIYPVRNLCMTSYVNSIPKLKLSKLKLLFSSPASDVALVVRSAAG
jgi:hypothetical protein